MEHAVPRRTRQPYFYHATRCQDVQKGSARACLELLEEAEVAHNDSRLANWVVVTCADGLRRAFLVDFGRATSGAAAVESIDTILDKLRLPFAE